MGTNTQRWNFHIHGATCNFLLGIVHHKNIYQRGFVYLPKVEKSSYDKKLPGKETLQPKLIIYVYFYTIRIRLLVSQSN